MSKDELFKEAVSKGIDNDAVMATLDELLNKMSENEITKDVFKEAIEIIILFKDKCNDSTNIEFSSTYLKNNGSKLIAALEKGISSSEISDSINKVSESLKYDIANFIAFMKEQEVKLKEAEIQKQNVDSFQKVLINENENK